MFWTLHSCSSGSITALAWMKVLEWMNVDWSHRDAFADLSKCKQDHFHFPYPYTSKDTFVRLLNMMKYFITFRHDLDENNRPIIENDDCFLASRAYSPQGKRLKYIILVLV